MALAENRPAFVNLIDESSLAKDIPDTDSLKVRRAAMELGAKSVISLPLVVDGQTFGVLTLYASERDFFDTEEVKLLGELAGDISFGLEFIAKEEKVDYLAYYDTLTGLPNRTLFFDRLTHQLGTAAREKANVALLLIDLDRFRQVNDSLGRRAGDQLLAAVGERLNSTIRDRDAVARVGPNRFALAISGLSDSAEVAHALESRYRKWFEPAFTIGGEELRISATVGVAMSPADGQHTEVLFANAEASLRLAKAKSARLLFYGPEMNVQVAESLRIETRLRRAIANHELVLWYQPKTGLATGKITGMEALMRWRDPESGLVPPAKFIPIMEQTGMILEAGNWALSQVAVDCRLWAKAGLRLPPVAVNVSPLQLRQEDFVAAVIEAARAATEAGGTLDLEITESLIMENIQSIIPKLEAIRSLGVKIYIDDFGTGYSSLAYIAKLPIHALKVDRSFVVDMIQSEESLTIVHSVISLAHSLKLRVVAEGVETEAQSTTLKNLACDEMQGYLVSKPVPPEDVPALIARLT